MIWLFFFREHGKVGRPRRALKMLCCTEAWGKYGFSELFLIFIVYFLDGTVVGQPDRQQDGLVTHNGKHLLKHFPQMIGELDIVSFQIVTVFSQKIEKVFRLAR